MEHGYTSAALEALARHTAREVGCEACRWWFAGQDRTRLYIEGKQVLPCGAEMRVLLEAPLP
jgi:hypothetical protein